MGKRKQLSPVTKPVATVKSSKYCATNIYMVNAGEGFRLPDENKKQQWAAGPILILEQQQGLQTTYEFYDIGDTHPWQWLNGLLAAGQWALTEKAVAPLLPQSLVDISPRFQGTTLAQRKRKKK